ncbi:MAG TPA: DUF5685 family protein [Clostridia bacterium]|nr:DUF5685 family protein [Clostridia bacterium]
MFGYVRPEKPDLLMRDFASYKAVYCGLCKAIGRRAGQIPRATVTYDMTFLAILLLALAPDSPSFAEEACILNPLKKRPMMSSHRVLDYAADLSCLLAYYSAKDDAADEKPIKGRVMSVLLAPSAKKASGQWPQLAQFIRDKLDELDRMERSDAPFEAADRFGEILAAIVREGYAVASRLPDGALETFSESDSRDPEADELYAMMLGQAGMAIGRWIYFIDAIDDLAQDRETESHNPFVRLSDTEAHARANSLLLEAEGAVDRNLALLTYKRFGEIVYNIVMIGMPAVRERILAGESLPVI